MTTVFLLLNRVISVSLRIGESYGPKPWLEVLGNGSKFGALHIYTAQNDNAHQHTSFVVSKTQIS